MKRTETPPSITIETLAAIDMNALRDEIAAKEAELELIIAEHRKAIDGRIALLKVVDVLQNGRKPRQKRGSRKAATQADTQADPAPNARPGRKSDRDKIADLLRSQGAMQCHRIAGTLGITEARVNLLLSSDATFEMDSSNGRWSVSG